MRRRIVVALMCVVPLVAVGLGAHLRTGAPEPSPPAVQPHTPLPAPAEPAGCPPETPSTTTVQDATVTSFDGTPIAVTVFRPPLVCEAMPVPAVLTLHGFGGTRDRAAAVRPGEAPASTEHAVRAEYVRLLIEAGYGVVGIDARGHGESGGRALLMHPSTEVRDFQAVIDWVHDTLPWVQRDPREVARNVKVATLGGSYGGAFALLTAAFDERVDAVVAMVTWNDLAHSLMPAGVLNERMVAAIQRRISEGARIDPRMLAWMDEAQAAGRLPAGMEQVLRESSPAMWMERIEVPTLLSQGMADELTNLNEAAATYTTLRAAGTSAWLWTHGAGHRYPEAGEVTACLDPSPRSPLVAFLDAHLRDDADARSQLAALPRVALHAQKGPCATADEWPVYPISLIVEVPQVQFHDDRPVSIPLFSPDGSATVAGIPKLEVLRSDTAEIRSAFVLSDADGRTTVNRQVTDVSLPGGPYTTDLSGIATALSRGDTLYLRLQAPAGTTISGMFISLPIG